MANILSTSQISQNFINFYKSAQPNMDTSPGKVARDVFVDGPSVRLGELYSQLSNVASSQSLSSTVGSELDNSASNYRIPRKQAGKSSGAILLTFNNILADITIPSGTLVYSKNGLAFRILSGFIISAANSSQYRALAITYKSDLNNIGITDSYAVQTLVECTVSGSAGNISKYGINSVSIPGISNVTNINVFSGGCSAENDASYRNNIIATLSGSNTGTELGYKNSIINNSAVLDAIVVSPGSPYMTRDNTILKKDSKGNLVLNQKGEPIILSAGTGGKVDIFVNGRYLTENTETFIFNDKSGKNDPTNKLNDHIVGQITEDINKTITQRRLDNIEKRTLPNQPVETIIEVIGSSSGTFSQAIMDQYGNYIGNYVLSKDTGSFGGSCWGFDKLHWVKNYITISENVSKNTFNGQDSLTYPDGLKITTITRTISVSNENSIVDPVNKSRIKLNHTPIKNVNKVLNYTTGERYVVANRNPDGENVGDLNYSGYISISGNNLPLASDILQVDYEWEYTHDPYIDYDSFVMNDNPRTAIDTIDWGYGNAIRREQSIFDSYSYTITTQHPISAIISINKVTKNTSLKVKLNYLKNNLIVDGLSEQIRNVVSVVRDSDKAELYNTKDKNGSFDSTTILLPTDTAAQFDDTVTVVFNAIDAYTINGVSGTFKDNVVYIQQNSILQNSDIVEVNYIANISEILPSTNLSDLPIQGYLNNFRVNGSSLNFGIQPVTNIYSGTNIISNLRKTPSKLGVNISGTNSNGIITIKGKTSQLIKDVIFTSTSSGLDLDLTLPIKNALGLTSTHVLPSNIKVSRLISLEKVEKSSISSVDVVTNVLYDFDIVGYSLQDNSYVLSESAIKTNITSPVHVVLPTTTTNTENELLVGDVLRGSFYITFDNDFENLIYSTNGTLYTNKSFVYINTISISSGFKSNLNTPGTISIFTLTQPPSGNRYKAQYNYLAPKNGERITIRYNTNALIQDLTFALEEKRQITADVLVKSAAYILIDVYATIDVLPEYTQTAYIVKQNVADKLIQYINNLGLGAHLNKSDLINVAYQVAGLDSIEITKFNIAGNDGSVSVINTLKTQYLQANTITIN